VDKTHFLPLFLNSLDKTVGIVTKLRTGWTGIQFSEGAGIFSLRHRVQTSSEP